MIQTAAKAVPHRCMPKRQFIEALGLVLSDTKSVMQAGRYPPACMTLLAFAAAGTTAAPAATAGLLFAAVEERLQVGRRDLRGFRQQRTG